MIIDIQLSRCQVPFHWICSPIIHKARALCKYGTAAFYDCYFWVIFVYFQSDLVNCERFVRFVELCDRFQLFTCVNSRIEKI